MNVNIYFLPFFVEAVYSKGKSFVEHLLPRHLQSKQYKAMIKDCHATESARVGTNIRMNSLRNFTVIFNNGLYSSCTFNPLKHELNPICYLLALLAHHFLHVSRIRVKSLTLR